MADPIETHLSANMNLSKKDIIIGNFLGGLSWGIGSVVGAGLIVAIIGFILHSLGFFQAIGDALAPLNALQQLGRQLPQIPQLYR
jgi:hypothetical protein